MGIHAGQLAPTFQATTYDGQPIDLEAYRGKKVWLGFYRWASCPLCNMRIIEVIERYKEFEDAGIQMLAVFQSPPENIAKHVGRKNPPFPLIADPDLTLYDTYGVRPSWKGMFYPRVFMRAIQATFAGQLSLKIDGPKAMVPADFLLDPEGLVWRSYYGQAISDHIPFGDVREFGKDLCLDMPEQDALL